MLEEEERDLDERDDLLRNAFENLWQDMEHRGFRITEEHAYVVMSLMLESLEEAWMPRQYVGEPGTREGEGNG